MKNPYTQPLESFTFDEMVEALDAISSETGRLDFKAEMIPRTELAYRACSFANAEGGLIVIGIKDPVEGQQLEFGVPPKTDDKERLRVMAQINSRVYPAPPLDVMGYRSADATKAVLVIRIGFSIIAPHEYTGGTEKSNLPVRRGTETDRLRLGEIELLRLRRTGKQNQSPIWRKMQPQVYIQPLTDSGFVGVSITPQTYAERRRILDVTDNHFIADLVSMTHGQDDRMHGRMTAKSLPDSLYLSTSDWKHPTGPVMGSVFMGPPHQIEIFSDGDIILRSAQTDQDATWQFIDVLLLSYTIAQGVIYHFGLRPEIRVHVIARFDERRLDALIHPADAYEDDFIIDLASETFSDAFCDTVMRLYRAGDNPPDRSHIQKTLVDFSRTVLPLGDELRPRWLTG
jgi:hypothetical protein